MRAGVNTAVTLRPKPLRRDPHEEVVSAWSRQLWSWLLENRMNPVSLQVCLYSYSASYNRSEFNKESTHSHETFQQHNRRAEHIHMPVSSNTTHKSTPYQLTFCLLILLILCTLVQSVSFSLLHTHFPSFTHASTHIQSKYTHTYTHNQGARLCTDENR